MTEAVFTAYELEQIYSSDAERVILRGDAKDRFLLIAKEDPLPDDVQVSGYRKRLSLGPVGVMMGREWYWEPVGLIAPDQRTGDEPV